MSESSLGEVSEVSGANQESGIEIGCQTYKGATFAELYDSGSCKISERERKAYHWLDRDTGRRFGA